MKISKKKDLVIIVPGIKTLRNWGKNSKRFINALTRKTHLFKPVYYDYARDWADNFKSKNRKVILLHWNRNLGLIPLFSAEKKLKTLIEKHHKNYDIRVVGISMGGKIAFDAARKYKKGEVTRLILVGAVGMPDKNPKINIPIINLYSSADKLARIASEIMRPFDRELKIDGGNVKNVRLDFGHDDLCLNHKSKNGEFNGKTVVQIIESLLT